MLGYCFDCKKHTIQMIRLAAKTKSDANSLRELVITDLLEKSAK
jgi:ribosomal protein L44E